MTDKTNIYNYLKETYKRNDATNGHYIVVMREGATMQAVFFNGHLVDYTTLDKASKGAGARLRFRQTKSLCAELKSLASDIVNIGTAEDFESLAKSLRNRGDAAEAMVCKCYGLKWRRSALQFWQGGDIVLNGQPYQIKFTEASFITEATADRLNGLA
jgi:hypothetical protein